MSVWLTVLSMGLVTFLIRFSVIGLLRDAELPQGVRRALRLVPMAVLTAIIFPQVLMPGTTLDLSPGNKRLLAAVGAGLVGYFSRRPLLAIVIGMVLLWLLQVVMP